MLRDLLHVHQQELESSSWQQFHLHMCASLGESCPVLQIGLDFYESQMVGVLPTSGLSSDVTSYRGSAFQYEDAAVQLGKGFGDITGGWCTGDEIGGSQLLPNQAQ